MIKIKFSTENESKQCHFRLWRSSIFLTEINLLLRHIIRKFRQKITEKIICDWYMKDAPDDLRRVKVWSYKLGRPWLYSVKLWCFELIIKSKSSLSTKTWTLFSQVHRNIIVNKLTHKNSRIDIQTRLKF